MDVGDDKENSAKGEIDQLRLDVSFLRKANMEMQEELLTHRSVLEQCLELREGVQELLQHREALTQCLELQDGIQAVLASAKMLGELRDREQEHELSLAGVSDNTARHGMAISTLAEQQKRTSSTLDAVVRAVKRLARSRSRSRGPGVSTEGLPAGMTHSAQGHSTASTNAVSAEAMQPQMAYLPPVLQEPNAWMHGDGHSNAAEDLVPTLVDEGLQADEWWRAPDIADDASQPRLLDDPLTDEPLDVDYGSHDDCLGWLDEDPVGGYGGPGNFGGFATSDDEPRFWSGSSSCGSDSRAWRASAGSRQSGRSGAGNRRSGSHGNSELGIPDTCLGGPGDLGSIYSKELPSTQTRRHDESSNDGPGASVEMANCVQGVMARIEEALTKLDGSGSRDRDMVSSGMSGGTSRSGTRRVPRSWAAENGDMGSDSRRSSRPRSARASTPRGGASTPRGGSSRARPGNTPYQQPLRQVDRLKQIYSNSDRWA